MAHLGGFWRWDTVSRAQIKETKSRKHQLLNQIFQAIVPARLFILIRKQPWNEFIPVLDFKAAWKQVLLTWRFISFAFQNDQIFLWAYVAILFRVVSTWYFITWNAFWVVSTRYFITWNEFLFLSKWLQWVSNVHAH